MSLLIATHLIVWICAGWLALIGLVLFPVLAICKAAQHADNADAIARQLDPALDRLSRVHAPSGTPFFAAARAREELVDEIRELVLLAG
jgi:hypothetical protein